MTPRELIEKAQQAVAEGRAALVQIETERAAGKLTEARKRELDETFDRAANAAEAFKAQADQQIRLTTLDTGLATYAEVRGRHPQESDQTARLLSGTATYTGTPDPRWTPEARAAFKNMLQHKHGESLSPVELRALDPFSDAEGGFAMTHEFRQEVIRQEHNLVQIRKYARVIPTNAASVTFPSFKTTQVLNKTKAGRTLDKADVRTILGKKSFVPRERGEIIKVPRQLVEDQAFPIDQMLAEEIGLISAETEESDFLTGDGIEAPYGVLSAPIRSVPIASTYEATPEDIVGLPYELRAAFRARGVWLMNRTYLQFVRRMRDNIGGTGTGQFLWQVAMTAGQPNTIAGFPALESEFMPNVITGADAVTGKAAALFGDWSQYWIIERLSLTIERLNELYAETNEIGFKYRKRLDAAPVRLEAFVSLTRA